MNVEDLVEEISKLDETDLQKFWLHLRRHVPTPVGGEVIGVEKTPGVCGGSARIVRTRIPVWTLVSMKRLGVSDEELLRNFPTLVADDLGNAWTYATIHSKEIDQDILENEES